MNNSSNYFKKVTLNRNRIEGDDISRIIVISDLHASEGKCPETCIWDRLENFTADQHFEKFLQQKLKDAQVEKKKFLLVINGDFIDFLRIRRTPQSMVEMEKWKAEIEALTADFSTKKAANINGEFQKFYGKWKQQVPDYVPGPDEKTSLWDKVRLSHEKKYGFKTENYKSVYRLMVAFEGHPQLFNALASWLAAGMELYFVTGNHDLELNQELVQKCLHKELKKRAANQHLKDVSEYDFSNSLRFFEQGIEIDGQIRIEHGHRFEWHTRTRSDWRKCKITEELRLPEGSGYNYYLINDLEKIVPHIDNVKPNTSILMYMLKNHRSKVWQAFKMLLRRVCLLSRRGTLRLFLLGVCNLLWALLVATFIAILWNTVDINSGGFWAFFYQEIDIRILTLPLYKFVLFFGAGLYLFYEILRELAPHFSLNEVKEKMSEGVNNNIGRKRYAICGHTHRAHISHWEKPDTVYFNAGSWSMVYEYEYGIMLRDDLSHAFVEFKTDNNENGWDGKLMRWLADHNTEAEMIILKQPLDDESSWLKQLIKKLSRLLKNIREGLKKWTRNGHTKRLPNLAGKN